MFAMISFLISFFFSFYFDLLLLLYSGLEGNDNPYGVLNDIDSMRIYASFKDGEGERAQTELLLFSHYSPSNRHIKVSTTTKDAKVREQIGYTTIFLWNKNYCSIIFIKLYLLK